jgi:hypothetical protein
MKRGINESIEVYEMKNWSKIYLNTLLIFVFHLKYSRNGSVNTGV